MGTKVDGPEGGDGGDGVVMAVGSGAPGMSTRNGARNSSLRKDGCVSSVHLRGNKHD